MERKEKCRKCGKWFTTDEGFFISRPTEYDNSLCSSCNLEIEKSEKKEFKKILNQS